MTGLARLARVRALLAPADLLGLLGAASLLRGVAMWSRAAAWGVAGLLLIVAAVLVARAETAQRRATASGGGA